MSEILPCPFCGCNDVYITNTSSGHQFYTVSCRVCGVMFWHERKPFGVKEDNWVKYCKTGRSEAIAAWNQRAPLEPKP